MFRMSAIASVMLVSPAAARGPASGAHGNAGGTVRGLERAQQVANPKGVEHGIEKAEEKIDAKQNPRNPNTETKEEPDTKSGKTSSKK